MSARIRFPGKERNSWSLNDLTQALLSAVGKKRNELHEQAAERWLQAHGRWPEYTWDVFEPDDIENMNSISIVVAAGDERPPGTSAVYWGALNRAQVDE